MNQHLCGGLLFCWRCMRDYHFLRYMYLVIAFVFISGFFPVWAGISTTEAGDSALEDGSTTEGMAEGTPSIAPSVTSFDAGKIKEGKKINHTFEFENIGAGELRILDIYSG